MRFKKWEKWYWGIAFAILIGLSILIILREKGFEATVNGKPTILSKTNSFLLVILLPWVLTTLWFWFVLRFWILKTNDFICKYCKKEFGASFETEKEVCKKCYEKNN